MQNTVTVSSGVMEIETVNFPWLRLVSNVPRGTHDQIEKAVSDFFDCSRMDKSIDKKGFIQQTYESIAASTHLRGSSDFWLAQCGDQIIGYLLARVTKDIDNRMTYWVSQAWVRKDYRGSPYVKQWWNQIKNHAKDCLCTHMVIVSSRNPEAYNRFLGNLTHYATLLREVL